MSERGFFGELLHRRVFQYLGLYIAGVWLAIEMGDWLSEQFPMPDRLTTYIFVFMAVMLPSVALVAWNHGAPGKDGTPKSEIALVPLNVLIAAASVFLVPARAPGPAVQVAESGADTEATAAMPELPSTQRVLAYYLSNDTAEAPDWFAYALPILVAEDLRRESTAFSVTTPFDSSSVLTEMRRAGFESAMRVPQSLQLQLARQHRYSYFMRGQFEDAGDSRFLLRYSLHDVGTGEVRASGEEAFTEVTLFDAIDRVSATVRVELESRLSDDIQATSLPASESMSTSLEALRLYTEARIATKLDRDPARAGELMQAAVAADAQFAEAHAALGMFHYFEGNNDLALAAFDEALRFGFRLSRSSEYLIKVNKAAISGDLIAARDTARAWVRIEPASEWAYLQLAELNRRANLDLDEALRAYETVRELNPMATETYKYSASLEQQKGNFEAAEALLVRYTESAPEDAGGLLQLARLQLAQARFDDALNTFREASIIDDRAISPEIGAILVLMRRGDYVQAEDRLTRLQARDLTDEERLQVSTVAINLYSQRGQYGEVIETLVATEPVMARNAGPLLTSLQARAPRINAGGYLLEDPTTVLRELDELATTLQPPWNDFVAFYKAGLLAAHDEEQQFLENMAAIERVVASQPANGNVLFMADTYRAMAALYRDKPENSVVLIRSALERAGTSFILVEQSASMLPFQAEMYDIMRRAGEAADAAAGLERIVAAYPGLAIAHLRLAQAYLALDLDGRAREALKSAKDIWRDADETLIYLKTVAQVEAELEERA